MCYPCPRSFTEGCLTIEFTRPRAALKESRERVFESTLAALQGASAKAVETLLDVMKDDKAQPSARVSAAKTVLELAIKGRDQLELSERLAYLEKLWEVKNGRDGAR